MRAGAMFSLRPFFAVAAVLGALASPARADFYFQDGLTDTLSGTKNDNVMCSRADFSVGPGYVRAARVAGVSE